MKIATLPLDNDKLNCCISISLPEKLGSSYFTVMLHVYYIPTSTDALKFRSINFMSYLQRVILGSIQV